MPKEESERSPLESVLDELAAEAEAEAQEAEGELEAGTADVEALQLEIADLKDRLLRSLAETENIRKRADRERRDAETYGATRFARDLLPVHDNFERALEALDDSARAAVPGLFEGIELTKRELLSAFEKHKILRVSPQIGDRFDPKLHQAMFEAPVPNTSAGDIIQVMNDGFTIADRLLRPAQVGVSSGGPAVPKPAQDSEGSAAG